VHWIKRVGPLAAVHSWIASLPRCCDIHRIIAFASKAEHAMRTHVEFAQALRNGRNFVLEGETGCELPYLFGKFNAAGRVLNGLRELARSDPRNGTIGAEGSRVTASNLFGDWFSMDDYQYFCQNELLDYIRGKLVADAVSPCVCYAEMPFHGVVVDVIDGLVIGPTFPLPYVGFQDAEFTPCTKKTVEGFVDELRKENDKAFKELHERCASIASKVLKSELKPRPISITEGTYGSGKTRRMIAEIRSKYVLPRMSSILKIL